jgi:hypothetical protein
MTKLPKATFVAAVRQLTHSEPSAEVWKKMFDCYNSYRNLSVEDTVKRFVMHRSQVTEYAQVEASKAAAQEFIEKLKQGGEAEVQATEVQANTTNTTLTGEGEIVNALFKTDRNDNPFVCLVIKSGGEKHIKNVFYQGFQDLCKMFPMLTEVFGQRELGLYVKGAKVEFSCESGNVRVLRVVEHPKF